MNSSPTISINFKDSEGVLFDVPSSTDENVSYVCHVWFDGMHWYCNCPDHYYRKHDCKHIQACQNILSGAVE